jgi:choline dehydrogenase
MYDYVVVGAGSAGCVLARRLSDDPAVKVALIEAGPAKHRSLKVRAPSLYQLLWRTPLDWNIVTEPQPHVANRKMYWPRGKVVGGTSCLNAMVYIRGHRANYDAWARLGNPGWSYADVLPYFKRSEDNARGASEYHGAGGPLAVSDQEVSPLTEAFCAATAATCGVRVTDDFNAAEQEGAGRYQLTTRGGVRASTAAAFLDPIQGRANLAIVPGALVTRIVVEGGRARGITLRDARGERTITAEREVILCAGAIHSPHLLMVSGIGPADALRAVGVAVVHDLPGVGQNLQDHLLAGVMWKVESSHALALSTARILGWMLRYQLTGGGPFATGPVQAGAFVKSSPAEPVPDIQFHVTPWGPPQPNTDEHRAPERGRRFTILPGLIYPRSVGELRLRSADPAAAPAVDPRYFTDPADLEHLVRGMVLTREIGRTAPLAGMLGAELRPGPDVTTTAALADYIRQTVNTIFHPVGTCKMGVDDLAVVDPELRVRGLAGLRVADAAIMPRIVGGNTNAPVIMIAEKAADLIRG